MISLYLFTLIFASNALSLTSIGNVLTGNSTKKSPSLMQSIKSNPKQFVEEMQNLDPIALRHVITLLEDLKTSSEARETDLVNDLSTKNTALNGANAQVVEKEGVLDDANDNVTAAEGALTAAQQAATVASTDVVNAKAFQTAKQAEKDASEAAHDGEIPSLNEEQQVLTDVIAMLEGLPDAGGPEGWIQLDASDIANAVCERVKGTAAVATVSSSGDKIDFLGYQNIPNNPGVLRCDIPTSVNFNQVKGQFDLVAVSGHHPDDNFAISSWGEGTSDHLGYIAFGTDSHIIIPGDTKGKDLHTRTTFTIPDTTVASTSTIRFEACQSYNAEDFQLGQFDIQIYALRG